MSDLNAKSVVSGNSFEYTIYTIPRRFLNGAKLHPVLARKTPDMVDLEKNEYTLLTVMYFLNIKENKMLEIFILLL